MSSSELWVIESPVDMISGETITFSVTFQGATSVTSPSATVYLNGTDYTSTAMPSGSHTASGNVATLKPLVAGANDGGEKYVVAVSATVDGNTELRKLMVNILKASDEQ